MILLSVILRADNLGEDRGTLPILGPDAVTTTPVCLPVVLQTPDLVANEQSLTYLRIALFACILVVHHGRIRTKVTQSGFIIVQMEGWPPCH